MLNINAFRPVVHGRRFLKICSNFPPFGPLNAPLRGQPLDFNKSESPFLRDAFYQPSGFGEEVFYRKS